MATSTNTIKTRVQLKSDTEANWNKAGPKNGSNGFIPLLGELIVYTADEAHHFSRLKVGDGSTNIINLPFIDAGTIEGETLPPQSVQTFLNTTLFPSPGQENVLYIDLSKNLIYCYTPSQGYNRLNNFTFSTETVSHITFWSGGTPTTLTCNDGLLSVITGTIPRINYDDVTVVKNINKE